MSLARRMRRRQGHRALRLCTVPETDPPQELLFAVPETPPGTHLHLGHDHWCRRLRAGLRGRCDCHPALQIVKDD